MKRFLLTGGAGFIGSRLAHLLAKDSANEIFIIDNLHSQVHGPDAKTPEFPKNVRFLKASITDREAVDSIVKESRPDCVIHLAAETGTGQSMSEIVRYCEVNVTGTAQLLESLNAHAPNLRRLVLPSSRSVYGEGPYRTPEGEVVVPVRSDVSMRAQKFEPTLAGATLTPIASGEKAPVFPTSIYASTKLMQEYLVKQGTPASTTILRFQNVYGPGQSLRNPYTGVLSIFCKQISEGKELNIFEDGRIVRDFVFVDDVVRATYAACFSDLPSGTTINIGSGEASSILDVARELLRLFGVKDNGYRISGDFRAGDIRHAVADIRQAEALLNWKPEVSLNEGLRRLKLWSQNQLEGSL